MNDILYETTEKLNNTEKNLNLAATYYDLYHNNSNEEIYRIKAIESAANAKESIKNYKHVVSIEKLMLSIYQTVKEKGKPITQNLDRYRDKNVVKKTIIDYLKKEDVYDKKQDFMTQFIEHIATKDIDKIINNYIATKTAKATKDMSKDDLINKFEDISKNIKNPAKTYEDKISENIDKFIESCTKTPKEEYLTKAQETFKKLKAEQEKTNKELRYAASWPSDVLAAIIKNMTDKELKTPKKKE